MGVTISTFQTEEACDFLHTNLHTIPLLMIVLD